MKLDNDTLKKMENNINNFNYKYAGYYFNMSEFKNDRFFKRAVRISNCMDFWLWDRYDKNLLLDLKSVNRCKNNRFCPNCRKLDLSKFLYSFRPRFDEILSKGYIPYFLTLTIPNCVYSDLKKSIDLLYKSFTRLWEGFSMDLSSKKSFKFRKVQFVGALKVLEITTNIKNKEFHPHLHCIIFLKNNIDNSLLLKIYKGLWSVKRQSYDYYSEIEMHFKRVWTLICKNSSISCELYNSCDLNIQDLYQVDFRELDECGLYEVIKYTMKDSDIVNQEVFEYLVKGLEYRRIRQGYGLLYNLKCENVDIGEYQELELEIQEDPVKFINKEIKELYTTYKDYRKISRFTPKEFNEE